MESFRDFCSKNSSIRVIDQPAWRDYLKVFRENDETRYRIVNISDDEDFDVKFFFTPNLVPKNTYFSNDISISRNSMQVAFIRSFSYKYAGFEGDNYANCALSFPELYRV